MAPLLVQDIAWRSHDPPTGTSHHSFNVLHGGEAQLSSEEV